MADFILDVDDIIDELYYELESIQDGYSGHKLVFSADSKEKAAVKICMKLTEFFTDRLEDGR